MKMFELEGVLAREADRMEWLPPTDTPGFGGVEAGDGVGFPQFADRHAQEGLQV